MGGTRENKEEGGGKGDTGPARILRPLSSSLLPSGLAPPCLGPKPPSPSPQYPRCPPQVSKTAAGLWGGPRGLPLTFVLFLGNTALPQA